MLFTVLSAGGFDRKPYSTLVLKPVQKICETRKLESIHKDAFLQIVNKRVENQAIS
jgi:hypothetical protein